MKALRVIADALVVTAGILRVLADIGDHLKEKEKQMTPGTEPYYRLTEEYQGTLAEGTKHQLLQQLETRLEEGERLCDSPDHDERCRGFEAGDFINLTLTRVR